MSLHSSFTPHGKAGILDNVPGRGQNRTREIRPSGIAGGPSETWPRVELGTRPATERTGVVTLHLRVRARKIYPDRGLGVLRVWNRKLRIRLCARILICFRALLAP